MGMQWRTLLKVSMKVNLKTGIDMVMVSTILLRVTAMKESGAMVYGKAMGWKAINLQRLISTERKITRLIIIKLILGM
jgi:hypothetical protein